MDEEKKRFKFSLKEGLVLLAGTALALGSFKSDDTLVVIPMLVISGLAFVLLCIRHQGIWQIRFSFAIVIIAILCFIGYRDFRKKDPAATISPTDPKITWNDPYPIEFGRPLTKQQLNATSAVEGRFSYTPNFGAILPLGKTMLSVKFIPFDTQKFTAQEAHVILTILPSRDGGVNQSPHATTKIYRIPAAVKPAPYSQKAAEANPSFGVPCPAGVPVYDLENLNASDNGGNGVSMTGTFCLKMSGGNFLRNVKNGVVLDQTPAPQSSIPCPNGITHITMDGVQVRDTKQGSGIDIENPCFEIDFNDTSLSHNAGDGLKVHHAPLVTQPPQILPSITPPQ